MTHRDEHLNTKYWLSFTTEQRDHIIKNLFIPYEGLIQLMAAVETHVSSTPLDENSMPPYLTIIGPGGVGKTALIETWRQRRMIHSDAGEDQIIPYLSLSPLARPHSLLTLLLTQLGDPSAARGTSWNKRERLSHFIKASQVPCIIIDNIEHLIDSKQPSLQFVIEDFVISITHLHTPIILLGREEDTALLFRLSPRLERRTDPPHILTSFSWDRQQPTTIQEFRAFLHSLDDALPFDDSGLDEEEMAYRIFVASHGNVGRLMALIRRAATQAMYIDEATISRDCLAKAYEECIATRTGYSAINPFATAHFSE